MGAEALVTAKMKGGYSAAVIVKIISKRLPPGENGRDKKRGLFRGVKPDPNADPRQRVYVRDHIIWIATKAPTIARYIGPALEGARDTPEGQVMLAELVAEAFCRDIARRRVERGRFVFPTGGEAEAREREARRLHNQYALRIHELFAPRQVARGRPTAAQMAEEAATPL